jgi:BirA family biotin operon repressor/biotin-[acetyl-CoA-carboxylase] ligase
MNSPMPVDTKFHILRFDSIDSTNLEGARRAKVGAPEGLCIIAREQTRGRGRLDRSWHSPKDAGLYVSIILRPKFETARWPLISLAAALAVANAIQKACGLRVDIKWPNDIHAQERKLCGILTETAETESGTAAIVGIGINLTRQSFPAELAMQATSIETVIGSEPDRESLLNELMRTFAQRYESLQSDRGAKNIIRDWCANSSYAVGCRVRVAVTNETFEGTTRGLESDGALRVETDEGVTKIVRAGDVTSVRVTSDE